MINTTAIITAAGQGLRMGVNTPKQYLKLGEDYIISLSIEKFHCSSFVQEIILVVSEQYYDFCVNEIKVNFPKITHVVSGGSTRQQSVHKGLQYIDAKSDIVLIHDAVRPFVKTKDIENIIHETIEYKSCVLGVKVKDTIKLAYGGIVKETFDRDNSYIVQTPQAFEVGVIKQAHDHAYKVGFSGTDDAVLVEQIGVPTKIVEGDYENIKITTPEDIEYAKFIIQKEDKI